jgi:hypothetical protein
MSIPSNNFSIVYLFTHPSMSSFVKIRMSTHEELLWHYLKDASLGRKAIYIFIPTSRLGCNQNIIEQVTSLRVGCKKCDNIENINSFLFGIIVNVLRTIDAFAFLILLTCVPYGKMSIRTFMSIENEDRQYANCPLGHSSLGYFANAILKNKTLNILRPTLRDAINDVINQKKSKITNLISELRIRIIKSNKYIKSWNTIFIAMKVAISKTTISM